MAVVQAAAQRTRRPDDGHPVAARHLAKDYGAVHAVRDLDLTVRRGEIYGFLGPNGAGKTTTLLMLLGIERPTGGTLELFGAPAPVDPFTVKRRIGVVGEAQYLYDDLSAWEHLMFSARLYGVDSPEPRARGLLERLGLWEFRQLRARDHSRGMQQKLGLARALLHQPDLLVLDEPVSGLDPHGIRQVREILLEENARGTTILISSHILSEVERTAHRVGILYGGRLVAEDTVAGIGARLRPNAVIDVDVDHFDPRLTDALRAAPFVRAVELAPNGAAADHARLHVAVAPDGDHRRSVSQIVAAHGGLITEMRQQRLSLEEAFIQLTSENVAPLASPLPPGAAPATSLLPEGEPTVFAGALLPRPLSLWERVRVRASRSALATVALPIPPGQDALTLPFSHEEREPRRSDSDNSAAAPGGGSRARLHAVRVILRKDLLSILFAPGIYGALALGMLAALLLVRGNLDAIERSRVLVLSDAFTLPFFVAATIASFFLALTSAASVAREREQGTLEALFYGPVDHLSYVLAKHAAQTAAFAPLALGIGVLLLLYAGMTGLRIEASFGLELLLSLVTAAAVAAVGVFLSTLTRGVRAAFALFGAVAVFFLAVRFGAEALSGIPVTNNLNPLLFLRDLLIGLDGLLGYVSPFGLFQNGTDALVRDDPRGYLASVAIAVAESALLLAASVRLLAARGVRR